MSILTNWGYVIEDTTSEEVNTLDPMLTSEEFDELTAGKYAGDTRIGPNIKAASAAIRNYCGWHVYPSYSCRFSVSMYHKAVTAVQGGLLIQLPAKFVSEVESIQIGDTTYAEGTDDVHFIVETNGIIRVFGSVVCGLRPYSWIEVVYTAGASDALMDGLKELVAHRVTHALASSGGIQSETAGGVSITYSANWTNTARSTALADDNKEVIAPFWLQGVF